MSVPVYNRRETRRGYYEAFMKARKSKTHGQSRLVNLREAFISQRETVARGEAPIRMGEFLEAVREAAIQAFGMHAAKTKVPWVFEAREPHTVVRQRAPRPQPIQVQPVPMEMPRAPSPPPSPPKPKPQAQQQVSQAEIQSLFAGMFN